ncbi:hypothetical protein ES708_20086 [subsurface metagenome]
MSWESKTFWISFWALVRSVLFFRLRTAPALSSKSLIFSFNFEVIISYAACDSLFSLTNSLFLLTISANSFISKSPTSFNFASCSFVPSDFSISFPFVWVTLVSNGSVPSLPAAGSNNIPLWSLQCFLACATDQTFIPYL